MLSQDRGTGGHYLRLAFQPRERQRGEECPDLQLGYQLDATCGGSGHDKADAPELQRRLLRRYV